MLLHYSEKLCQKTYAFNPSGGTLKWSLDAKEVIPRGFEAAGEEARRRREGGRVADRYIGLEGDSQPEEHYELQQRLITEWEQSDRQGLIPVLDFVPAVAPEAEEEVAMEDGAEE